MHVFAWSCTGRSYCESISEVCRSRRRVFAFCCNATRKRCDAIQVRWRVSSLGGVQHNQLQLGKGNWGVVCVPGSKSGTLRHNMGDNHFEVSRVPAILVLFLVCKASHPTIVSPVKFQVFPPSEYTWPVTNYSTMGPIAVDAWTALEQHYAPLGMPFAPTITGILSCSVIGLCGVGCSLCFAQADSQGLIHWTPHIESIEKCWPCLSWSPNCSLCFVIHWRMCWVSFNVSPSLSAFFMFPICSPWAFQSVKSRRADLEMGVNP